MKNTIYPLFKMRIVSRILFTNCIFFLFLFSSNISFTQPNEIHDVPDNYAKPFWAYSEYWENPNIFDLDSVIFSWSRLGNDGKGIEGETDPYLNAYKRWRNKIEPYIDHQGKIISMNEDSIEEYFNRQQSSIGNIRSAPKTAGNWKLIGPSNTFSLGVSVPWQANIYTLAIDNRNPNIIYAGSETGNIFKSENKGINWHSVGDDIPYTNASVTAIAIAPDTYSTVFAYFSSNRLIKSSDGGKNWTQIDSYFGGLTEDIEINPLDGKIFIASKNGVLISKNSGNTWNTASGAQFYKIYDIAIGAVAKDLIFASGTDSQGNLVLLKSTDAGDSFVNVTSGLSTIKNMGSRIAVTAANGNIAYCIVLSDSKPYLLKTLNKGDTWTIIAASSSTELAGTNSSSGLGMSNGQGFFDLDLCVSNTNAKHVIVGTTTAYKSIDGGLNFVPLGGYFGPFNIHPDIQCIKTVGGDSYIATDGGISYSSDFFSNQNNYEARINGLSASEFWGFDQGWDEDIVVGGRYHNGNTAISEKYGPGNSLRLGGGEDATGHIFHGHQRKVGFRDIGTYILPESTSGQPTYAEIQNTKWPTEDFYGQFSSKLIFDPRYRNIIYVGNGNVLWKSFDEGNTYKALYTFPGKVWRFDISRKNPLIIYLSTTDGLYKTVDGGIIWSKLNLPVEVIYSFYNSDIIVSPLNEDDVYFCMGTNPNHANSVFNSLDGGKSWINITGNTLNGAKVAFLQSDGSSKRGIYAISNFPGRVYYRNSAMSDWIEFSEGLPENMSARQGGIIFFRDNKIRICGNRGIWESPLYQPAEPIAQPMTIRSSYDCIKDTVSFYDYSILKHAGSIIKWDFPGSQYVSSNTSRTPKVVYPSLGTYDVKLTIIDDAGNQDSKLIQKMINIGTNICSPDSIPGKALNVSHNSTILRIGTAPLNSNSFTISCWIKPHGLQKSFAQLISHDPYPGSEYGFGLGFSFLGYTPNLNLCYTDDIVGYGNSSNLKADSTQWNHVALVYSPNGVQIYLNGKSELVNSRSMPKIDLSKSPFYINRDIHKQGGYFNGLIDEVKIYDYNLTVDEIRSKMHLISPANMPEKGLIKYVQFNKYSNHSVYDIKDATYIAVDSQYLVKSGAPVGIGLVQKITSINSGGNYSFESVDLSMRVKTPGTYPNGDVYAIKLNSSPDTFPDSNKFRFRNNYWILRNFGTNQSNISLDSISFKKIFIPGKGISNQDFRLYFRGPGAYDSTWKLIRNKSDVVITKPELVEFVQMSISNKISEFGQFLILDSCIVDTSIAIAGGFAIPEGIGICKNDSVVISAVNGQKYEWLKNEIIVPGAMNRLLSVKTPGQFRVIVTNQNGYSDTSSNVQIHTLSPPLPQTENFISYCQNETTAELKAVSISGHKLNWYSGNALGDIPVSIAPKPSTDTAGTFEYYVSQFNMSTLCESEKVKITINIYPTEDKPIISMDTNGTLLSSFSSGNQWFKDGAPIDGAIDSFYKPVESGKYTVQVTENICSSPFSDIFNFVLTSLKKLDDGQYIRIYPNPATSYIHVTFHLKNHLQINLDIRDISGHIILRKESIGSGESIPINKLSPGLYTISATTLQNRNLGSETLMFQ